jgi:hypothetical protein
MMGLNCPIKTHKKSRQGGRGIELAHGVKLAYLSCLVNLSVGSGDTDRILAEKGNEQSGSLGTKLWFLGRMKMSPLGSKQPP